MYIILVIEVCTLQIIIIIIIIFNSKLYSSISYCLFIAGTDEPQSADLSQYKGNCKLIASYNP